jgi:pectin methylesterase-like acyl-CoA thioesterase
MNRGEIWTAGLTLALAIVGCGDDSSGGDTRGADATGGGGSMSTGGSATGGLGGGGASLGGQLPTGGVLATGGTGAIVATGGLSATGGTMTGGSPTAGGTMTGGAPPTGGTPATGGAPPTGGLAATGGVVETGGTAGTGGTPTGTGGASDTGGAPTGGAPTGGAATGGSSGLCPAGIAQTIVVAQDGSGDFTSVQSAVDSIPSGSTAPTRIDIKAGTYTEKITIASRSNLCLVGEDSASTVLTYDDANATVGSTSGSASVHVSADDFSAAQLTFQNGYGPGSQAVALRTTGQRQQFLDCRFVAYQDTLYTHDGTQYFRDCYVQGNTDYVFGHGVAILQNCEVRNVQGGSAVTAPNTTTATAFGIVFLGGHFTAESGINNVALARPWGEDGAAAFLNVTLDGHISAAGFTDMSGNDPANARFREYQSTGGGANPAARPSYQMSDSEAADYTIANIYGGAWTPSYSQ